ncbi:UDP-4-amino-4,6-dideoxy-N-acetyl-beta-L-altrosamine transaminase [Candidatus Omnitrophota bacterium]
MKTIPCSRQHLTRDDINAVKKVLVSDWLTQGPTIKRFERSLCDYTGSKYALAVSSGTAALHLSMLALDINRGDKVLTSPITFSASANCVLYVGACPKFIDINDYTYHLDIEKVIDFLKIPSQRKRVKAVVLIHFMGTVFDIVGLKRVCDKYGISIVEDAAHALGARYLQGERSHQVGGCRHSDVTIFSFHPIKNITTGEGGALLTNDKRIYKRALLLRHHGIVKSKKWPLWYYDIPRLGFNYRITDIQCALGISQLQRLNAMIKKKRMQVQYYNTCFSGNNLVRVPCERPDTYAAYHLYVVRVPSRKRNSLYNFLRKSNIFTQINYIPVHLLSLYKDSYGYKKGDFPIAEKFFSECLSLPLHVGLTQKQQAKIIKKVNYFLNNG